MSKIKSTIIFIFLLQTAALCQDSDTLSALHETNVLDTVSEGIHSQNIVMESEVHESDTVTPPDTSINTIKTADEAPENPFITQAGETSNAIDTGAAIEDSSSDNPFVSQQGLPSEQQQDIESDTRVVDILVDLSAGFGYSLLFDVAPENYTISGKGNFTISGGIMLPVLKICFTKISVSYFQVSYSTSFTTPDAIDMYVKRTGTETFHFLSAPINFGLRFDLGKVFPLLYFQFEPAYLTSAGRNTVTEIHCTFSDTAYLQGTISESADITMDRERHQIFLGAGAGVEFFYGYGTVYINGGFRYPLLEPGDTNSKPERSAGKFINFPFSLGIRFYL